jgi:uncharacterized protein
VPRRVVKTAVQHIPSSFSTQPFCIVVLLRDEHDMIWSIVIDAMADLVKSGQISKEVWQTQKPKLEGLKAAYGAVRIL